MIHYKLMKRGCKKSYTLKEIQRIVSESLGVTIKDIESKSRIRKINEARIISSYLIRELTNHSLKHIGSKINRDHATILHHVKTCKDLIDYDPEFKEKFNLVKKKIIL